MRMPAVKNCKWFFEKRRERARKYPKIAEQRACKNVAPKNLKKENKKGSKGLEKSPGLKKSKIFSIPANPKAEMIK